MKVVPLALLDSIDLVNVPSDLHTSISEFSSATGSNSPTGLGTTMTGASPDFVLNMPRSSREKVFPSRVQKRPLRRCYMSRTVTLDVGGMTCDGCASNVTKAINSLEAVSKVDVSHDSGKAIVTHDSPDDENIRLAIMNAGYSVDGESEPFNWKDGPVWRQSAHNTKWCLIGCSIGDFGTIAAFQFIPYLDALDWSAMSIMMLAMFNGIMTSIALETFILIKQMGGIREAFRVAIGMSLISMIAMETSMNATDLLIMGEPSLTWWVIPIMLFVGFITPWPYNYWRLKKYGLACH